MQLIGGRVWGLGNQTPPPKKKVKSSRREGVEKWKLELETMIPSLCSCPPECAHSHLKLSTIGPG